MGPHGEEVPSTIQTRPTVSWPMFGDDDHDLDKFREELEEVCGLANNGRGMSYKEMFRVLGSCLKKSRHQTYQLWKDECRKTNLLESSPEECCNGLWFRMEEFKESMLEIQTRLQREWDSLQKGNQSGVQFFPRFQKLVTDMSRYGLEKGETELLLAYRVKVGQQAKKEILKDKRTYTAADGSVLLGQVKTWREAHKVLLENEAIDVGSKALAIAPVGVGDGHISPTLSKKQQKQANKFASTMSIACLLYPSDAADAPPSEDLRGSPFIKN